MQFAKRTATALAAVIAAAGLVACNKVRTESRAALPADASAQVIGVKPADPTGDPPGTTPVASNTTTITKQEEISQKPQEGDNHSHSSLAQDNPQKGDDGKDALQSPQRRSDQ